MLISKIELINKKRYYIYLDDKLAFVLYKRELRHYGICEGEELDAIKYNEITTSLLPKRALARCFHLLEKRDYTEKELIGKLKDGRYPDVTIDAAINRLKEYGYINDDNYAYRYIECHIHKKSINQIKQYLYRKGINQDIFNKAYIKIKEDGYYQDEDEMINRILNKRHFFDKSYEDKKQRDKEYFKQYNYLMGKGFSNDAVRRCLKSGLLDITY